MQSWSCPWTERSGSHVNSWSVQTLFSSPPRFVSFASRHASWFRTVTISLFLNHPKLIPSPAARACFLALLEYLAFIPFFRDDQLIVNLRFSLNVGLKLRCTSMAMTTVPCAPTKNARSKCCVIVQNIAAGGEFIKILVVWWKKAEL